MAGTLADMKAQIALEFRRGDLTTDIANAITVAITAYKYERFPFNRAAFVDAPATDAQANNPWMIQAERLIRCRAKLEIAVNVIKYDNTSPFVSQMMQEVQDALTQLRRSQTVSNITATPGTLGYMKTRIANEINRGEFANEIADAILDAIDVYSNERFYFNETRENPLPLIANQSDYSKDDNVEVGRILKLDFVKVYAGGLLYDCEPQTPGWMEEALVNGGVVTGIPSDYTWYNQRIRLYPVPNDVYQLRYGYVRKMPPPATDIEADNVWMVEAEKLIRARSKAELYTHVEGLADVNLAAKYLGVAADYLSSLEGQTTRMTQIGSGARVLPYD